MVTVTLRAASKMHAWNATTVCSRTNHLGTFPSTSFFERAADRSACDCDSVVIPDDRIALLRMINEVGVVCWGFRTIDRQFINGRRISGLAGMQLS
jgi:hypothetical protein